MLDIRKWLYNSLSEKEIEVEIEKLLQKADAALESLKKLLRKHGVALLIKRKEIKRERMILFLEVEGLLVSRGSLLINFELEKEFGDVYFYGFPKQNEEDLIPIFTDWFGFAPHHRYHLKTYKTNNRVYCYDKNFERANFVMNDTQRKNYAYGIERLSY